MRIMFRSSIPLLALLSFACPSHAESSIALNLGLSSQSIVGVSYRLGNNQLNAGLKAFSFNSEGDYLVQPGLTYNRYFTESGWFGTLTYAPVYQKEIKHYDHSVGLNPSVYDGENRRNKGWEKGDILVGAGKNFQFTSWGINVDGGFIHPLESGEGFAIAPWFGIGASYRFKLTN